MALPDPLRYSTPDAIVSVLTTELNALANDAMSALSGAQDQDALMQTLADFELTVTFATAPVAGERCCIYATQQLDGTNDSTSNVEIGSHLIGVFLLDDVTTLQRIVCRNIQLPSTDFKIALFNEAGQAFPATGSLLKMRRYSIQVVD